MAGSVNSNYFSQVNSRFQTEVTRGDGASTQNLKNQSGVTHTAKKSTVKKGGNIAEEGSNLSEAAQKQLKSEATQHAEHAAEHGHEMAHDAGVDIAGNDSPEQNELRSKRGYEREQEALADGPTPDGKVKLTSPEGKTQILTVEDHDHLTAMDDPDVTDRHILDDIPDVNLNAANATLDTQMAQGVSKVAILKTDPKIDAVAESMEVAPAPHLAEPMDIVGPGNDKLSTPMPMEFPPEMERVAAEKAALELASGDSHQEAILAGPGMSSPDLGSAAPSRPSLQQIKTNSAAANLLARAPAGTWGPVADLLGVKPGQGKGVTPTGSPEEKQAQVMEWRVGHALELEQAGHGGLALQTLAGEHDRLVGKDVLATTVKNDATTQAFHEHYGAEGGQLKNEDFRPLPQDLHGRQVAFLAPDENGLLKEVRGQMKASPDEGSAIFELVGKPGQTFNNNYVRDLAVLPDDAQSIAPMPAVTVPPEAFAARLQNNRTMPRDEMLTKVAASATPGAAKVLFEAAGVKPGQGSGADFKPGQLNQWRLGQAAQLAEANQGTGMSEVLSGKWDNLSGQDVQQHLQQRAEFKTGFQDHYRKNGAHSVEKKPHELNGKTVAFLQENKETGKFEEVRGVLQHPGGPFDAGFTLQGHPGVKFNSNYIDSVVVLPNQGVPPYTQPAAQTEPKVPTTQLPPQATIEQLDQFSKPLAQTQLTAARSQLNPNQKKDLEQLETDVVRIRGLYQEMGARPQDKQFAAKAYQEIQQTQTRIGEVAGRNHAKNSNFQVIIDPTNGEVFTNLSWINDKLSPEMQAQGHSAVAYSLQSSPGRTDSELTAWPLAKDGSVGGTYMKYRVASDNPKGWQGVAAVVGDVNGENGYHASAITPGSNALSTHLNSDQQKMTPAQQALANQAMGDAGLTWPGGATPPAPPEQQAYRNQPGQIQQPVQQGFIDRMRYAFTGNQNYAPNYTSAPPPYWQAPQPNYNYMGSYPQYQYPPVNYGGYGGYAGSWGGGYGGGYGGGGMNTMMKLMMASTMISSIAMPMMFFANSMMW